MPYDWNIPFINKTLSSYLENDEYNQYSKLINMVIADDTNPGAKYNLYALFMNHGTEKIVVENLTKKLHEFYCSDANITEYVKNAVCYNPKLGYISISAKSRRDMNDDYTLDICIPCKSFEDSERIIKRVEEVLTMMLMEAKTVSP
jgi:hypothetical protein